MENSWFAILLFFSAIGGSFFSQLQRWCWRADLHHDLGSRTNAVKRKRMGMEK